MIFGALTRPTRFLTLAEVQVLHATLIDRFGGSHGIRDQGLLESALAMPEQAFGGESVHHIPFGMASAYAFHLCKNHPFIDGNKRIALATCIAFLQLNGWEFAADEAEAVAKMLDVAQSACDKDALEEWIASQSRPRPSIELREFFARVSLTDSLQMAEAVKRSDREEEAERTTAEARHAIPMIHELEQRAAYWEHEGNVAAEGACRYAIALLASFYRIAEDMGYEW